MRREYLITFSIALLYMLASACVVALYPLLGETEWTILGNTQYASWWLKGGITVMGLRLGILIWKIKNEKLGKVMYTVGSWYASFDIIMYWITNDQYNENEYYFNIGATIAAAVYTYIKMNKNDS